MSNRDTQLCMCVCGANRLETVAAGQSATRLHQGRKRNVVWGRDFMMTLQHDEGGFKVKDVGG